jgi:hypothetical protein
MKAKGIQITIKGKAGCQIDSDLAIAAVCLPQAVTITNTGGARLVFSAIKASGNFVQTNDCGSDLQPGASSTIEVFFRPRSQRVLTGKVTVTGNAPDSPQKVLLSGTGS